MWYKIFAFIFVAVLFIALYFYFTTKSEKFVIATVLRVIDGDTIELANGDKVRLVGIDSPEYDQLFYREVTNELEKLEGKKVRLEKDVTNKDNYGRLLRYVYYDDYFVNLELLKSGLASAYIVSPDVRFATQFFSAEKFAQELGIGIWKRSEFSACILLKKFNFNAKGNDAENLNDEYFILENGCDAPIELTVWEIRDSSFNKLILPNYSLAPAKHVTIFSGNGLNSDGKIFWNSSFPIWNNAGDKLQIRDSSGNLILFFSYGE